MFDARNGSAPKVPSLAFAHLEKRNDMVNGWSEPLLKDAVAEEQRRGSGTAPD